MGKAAKEAAKKRRIERSQQRLFGHRTSALHLADAENFAVSGQARPADKHRYYLMVGNDDGSFTIIPVNSRFRMHNSRKTRNVSLDDAEAHIKQRSTPLDVRRFFKKEWAEDKRTTSAAEALGLQSLEIKSGPSGGGGFGGGGGGGGGGGDDDDGGGGGMAMGGGEDGDGESMFKAKKAQKKAANVHNLADDDNPDEADYDNVPEDFDGVESDEELPAVEADVNVRSGRVQGEQEEDDLEEMTLRLQKSGKTSDDDTEPSDEDRYDSGGEDDEDEDEDEDDDDKKDDDEDDDDGEDGTNASKKKKGKKTKDAAPPASAAPAPAAPAAAATDRPMDTGSTRPIKRKADTDAPRDAKRLKADGTPSVSITQSAASKLFDKEKQQSLKADIIRYLNRKPMTVGELSKKLKAYLNTETQAEKEAVKEVYTALLKQLTTEVKIEGQPHRKLKEEYK